VQGVSPEDALRGGDRQVARASTGRPGAWVGRAGIPGQTSSSTGDSARGARTGMRGGR
jgi:hypothetical protein